MDGSFLRLPPSGTAAYVRGLQTGFDELRGDLDLRLLDPDWPAPRRFRGNWLTCTTEAIWHDGRFERMRWELFGVARKARKTKAQLLHIPHFSAPIRAGLPLVITIHDVIPLVLPEYRASAAMRTRLATVQHAVRQARIVLTPSQAAAKDIQEVLGFKEQNIRITPEAADERYVPAPDRDAVKRQINQLGITDPYIFNVGGLDVRKNVPLLIEAFASAKSNLPARTKLVIAGTPHSKNRAVFPPLEPLIAKLGLQDSVVLPGRVTEEDKLLLYQGANLYVTPSLYEGFGLTPLEAMACGVPTIAANRTSLPEVVGGGGLLVEPEIESVAHAIIDVMTNEGLAMSLQAKALARAAQFSWRQTAALTLEAYRDVLTRPR